ncbi:MAG: transcriptional regulator PpsR [Halioglobus sp.]
MAALLEKVADFSMLVDVQGQILEVAVASDELGGYVDDSWVGRNWADTVTEDGRDKVREMLQQSGAKRGVPLRRDVVHRLADGSELPVQYRLVGLAGDDRVLAVGQDMRPVTNLRQQLLNAQQALEQDYWRLRQVETRYRRLFEMVSDAIIVVDDASGRVLEANPAASELLGTEGQSIVGKPFPLGFDDRGTAAVNDLLAEIRSVGKGSVSGLRAGSGEGSFTVTASFLRQGGEARFLVRLTDTAAGPAGGAPGADRYLQETLWRAPDAVIQTDADGRILATNQSFLELAQLVSEEQALGHSADRWLGRSGVDLNVLLTNLRQRDSVKLFASTLHGEHGTSADVEVSACRVNGAQQPVFAFFIRDIARRVGSEHPMTHQLPRSIEQVTQRVGRVPLKELVRESTDIIEALCIEAALKLTRDNRASAAELLGLSRQSLYAKLRRYGIGGSDGEGE